MPFKYALPFRNFPNERNHLFSNGEFKGLLFAGSLLCDAKSSATFTRASGQWIEDYQGVLQYVADDVPGFKGARLSGSTWYNTDSDGNPILEKSNYSNDHATSTEYEVGDKVYLSRFGLTCTIAGTSGGTAPTATSSDIGSTISDGGVTWAVDGYATLEGIQLEEASTNKCECWSVPTPQDAGSELVTNGDFANWTSDDPDGWSVTEVGDATSNVTESAGACRLISDGTLVGISQSILNKGKIYQYSFDIISISGVISIDVTGGGSTIDYNDTGTKTGTFIAENISILIKRKFGNSLDAVIDNVSVKDLPQAEGTKSFYDTGWIQNIPGMTVSGDTAGTLEIVSETEANLQSCLDENDEVVDVTEFYDGDYLVYEADNTGGSAEFVISGTETTDNANACSLDSFIKVISGSAILRLSNETGNTTTETSAYKHILSENQTPDSASEKFQIALPAGAKARFIIPKHEEKAFATSPIKTDGASKLRDATLLSYPVQGNLPVNDFSIEMKVTPWATGQSGARHIFASQLDGENRFVIYIYGDYIYLTKKISAINHSAAYNCVQTKDTLFTVKAIVSSTRGLELSINAGTPETDNNTDNCVLGSTFEIGSRDNSQRDNALFKDLKIYKYAKPASWLEE